MLAIRKGFHGKEHTVKENDISIDELAEAHKILDGFDGDIGSLFETK